MHRGVVYMLPARLLFSIVNALVKFLHYIPVSQIVFFRSLITLIVAFIYLWLKKMKDPQFKILGNNKKMLLARGLFGVTALYLLFLSIKHLPLATATTLQYTSPLFTILIASGWHKEKTSPVIWLLLLMAFTGIMLLKGFDNRVSTFYLIIGLISAFISGLAYNVIKGLGKEDPVTIVMYFPLVGIPVMIVPAIIEWQAPGLTGWLLLLSIGILTFVAQYYMTLALLSDKAWVIVPFKFAGVIYAIIIGIVFFKEYLPFFSLLGIALIVLSLILINYYRNNFVEKN